MIHHQITLQFNELLVELNKKTNIYIFIIIILVDSIEEHFARSLGKFWPLTTSSNADNNSSLITESVVDDHFAKALGATTWEKLKEKS
jgi:hypothetical protein